MTAATFIGQERPLAPSMEAGRFWMWRAAYGLLLGISIAVLEFAHYYPLVSTPDRLGVLSLLSSLLTWGGEGVLLALTVALFERRDAPRLLGPRQLALAVVAGSVAGVLAWQAFVQLVLREQFGIWLFRDHLGQPMDGMGTALYHTWLMLFFGGLAATVQLSRQRHARVLAVLRAAELDRETSQRRLAEAGLAALQARIDPDFLFQTLAKLEQLYEADPPGADRLLEELIAFLRGALADIRLQSYKEGT
jgi:histidine kinase